VAYQHFDSAADRDAIQYLCTQSSSGGNKHAHTNAATHRNAHRNRNAVRDVNSNANRDFNIHSLANAFLDGFFNADDNHYAVAITYCVAHADRHFNRDGHGYADSHGNCHADFNGDTH
jgi:hypothetical protein